jgi:hypothetical protein
MKAFFMLLGLPLLLTGCAATVRSTVDGYGESPLSRADPLYFDREALPLAERPVSDSCRDAAKALGLTVENALCPACRRVEVRARLAGTTQAIRSGPTFGTSFGLLGGASGFGVGLGTGNTRSEEQAERVIEVGIFERGAKNLLRTITTRSIGRENSVPAVAYEMCIAAFREYPQNLKGKEYSVKTGAKE